MQTAQFLESILSSRKSDYFLFGVLAIFTFSKVFYAPKISQTSGINSIIVRVVIINKIANKFGNYIQNYLDTKIVLFQNEKIPEN